MRYVLYGYIIVLSLFVMYYLSFSVDLFDGLLGGVITLTGVLYVLTYKSKSTLYNKHRILDTFILWTVLFGALGILLGVKQHAYLWMISLFKNIAHDKAEVFSFLTLLAIVYNASLLIYRDAD